MEREYLRVAYLVEGMRSKAASVPAWPDDRKELVSPGPVTYIGVEQPEVLPEGPAVYTLANLGSLIPV
jgi:hypothetical protein